MGPPLEPPAEPRPAAPMPPPAGTPKLSESILRASTLSNRPPGSAALSLRCVKEEPPAEIPSPFLQRRQGEAVAKPAAKQRAVVVPPRRVQQEQAADAAGSIKEKAKAASVAPSAQQKVAAPSAKQKALPAGNNGQKRAQPEAKELDRYTGVIGELRDTGAGFIHCPALYEMFSQHVAASAGELAGFDLGDSVSFIMSVDSQGLPVAENVEACASAPKRGKEVPARRSGVVIVAGEANGRSSKPGKIQCRGPAGHLLIVHAEAGEVGSFVVGDTVSFLTKADAKTGLMWAIEIEAELEGAAGT